LSQVLAITNNETAKAPEPSDIQRNGDNFLELLEKEKLKSILHPIFPGNLQSFFNSSLFSVYGSNNPSNRTEDTRSVVPLSKQEPLEAYRSDASPTVKEQKNIQSSATADISKQDQAEQIKFAEKNMNRIFAGEIELTNDLYAAVINAKNRMASLGGVDADDLILQIKDKIRLMVNGGLKELSVELKPENLGTIVMNISSNKGALTVNIYADQSAKQALEEYLSELKSSLKLANLNIDDLKIFSIESNNYKGETG